MLCKLELCLSFSSSQSQKSLGEKCLWNWLMTLRKSAERKSIPVHLSLDQRSLMKVRIRLCYCCALIISCSVYLTCTDLKTFLKHAQQELQRVFNTACGFSNAQEVVHRQKAAMRTKVNVLRMRAHSLCKGGGKLTDSHIAGTCHSIFSVITILLWGIFRQMTPKWPNTSLYITVNVT